MSAQPTHTNPTPDPGQQAEDAQYYRQVLHDVIGMATDLARTLHAQATTPPPPRPTTGQAPPSTPEIAAAFDRIARAIRRSITLARHLNDPIRATPDPAHHRAAARAQVIRTVEDRIHRAAHEGDRTESLTVELHDRLDGPDLDADLGTRPIPDIITEICRDLGLASPPGDTPWKRRTPADLAQLHARAAAPSRHPGAEAPRTTPPPAPLTKPPRNPTLTPRTPGPTRPGPAATILLHPTSIRPRWCPPPDPSDPL